MLTIVTRLLGCSCAAILAAAPTTSRPVATAPDDKAQNRLSTRERAEGFSLLFNGRDLTHWKPNGEPGSFEVKDSVIIADRTDKGSQAYWLSTEREYADFELRVQYRITPGGNSGIFIRAPHEGRTSKMGMEIQILDDGGREGTPGVGDTGSIYRVVASKAFASKPAGAWNDLWILCDGPRVRVTLNGKVINDALMTDYTELQSRPRKGYIGLSAHTKPTHFRNIRLREIVHEPAGPATQPANSAPVSRPAATSIHHPHAQPDLRGR